MKPIRLSDLKSKKNAYFKRLGQINSSAGRYMVRYIVRRSLEALPKADKKFVEDTKQLEKTLTNLVMVTDEPIDVYKAVKSYSSQQQYKSGYPRKRELFQRFKNEYPELFSKYNSYMYRHGFSASNYYFEHAKLSWGPSEVTATVELPSVTSVVKYGILELTEEYSGDNEFWAELY
jgi:cyclopropane fatty-acyl-phospholipid synthase-like methyltransferase